MTQFNREETITLVSKNPAMVALFLHRALGEGFTAFDEGTISPADLVLSLTAAHFLIGKYVRGEAHELPPYREFVGKMLDSGIIEITGEIGRLSDPAAPQTPRTVN